MLATAMISRTAKPSLETIDPYIITNIGFQYSFIVTFGLLACIPVFMKKLKALPDYISGSVLVPTTAQIWASPIQIFYFNNFAAYSIPANVLVLPLFVILTSLGFIGSMLCLVPFVGKHICWLFDKCAEPFVSLLILLSKFATNLPGSLHYFASPCLISLAGFYIFVLLITLQFKLKSPIKFLNYVILAIFLGLIAVFITSKFPNDLKITVFDIGEGDSILVQTPANKHILVDDAPAGLNGFSKAKSVIIPYLRHMGIDKLDILLLTHPDSDHIGGTVDILQNVNVGLTYENGDSSKSKTYKLIADFIAKNNIRHEIITNYKRINLDKNVEIQALRPRSLDRKSRNEDSIILYLKYKEFSGLLMADNDATSMDFVKKYVKRPINFIKVGHHGSYNCLDKDMVKYLKPEIAVISVGRNNKYHHPNPRPLAILRKFHVKTYRTDKNFAFMLKTNGKTIKTSIRLKKIKLIIRPNS